MRKHPAALAQRGVLLFEIQAMNRKVAAMNDNRSDPPANLHLDGKNFRLEMVAGSMGDRAVHLGKLRSETGCMAFDPGMANTAICRSPGNGAIPSAR